MSSVKRQLGLNTYRNHTDLSPDKDLNWTELNKFIHKDYVKPVTIVGQTPMLNAKEDAHNIIGGRYVLCVPDTIHSEVKRAIHIIELLALECFCQIIGQGDIHCIAMEGKFTT